MRASGVHKLGGADDFLRRKEEAKVKGKSPVFSSSGIHKSPLCARAMNRCKLRAVRVPSNRGTREVRGRELKSTRTIILVSGDHINRDLERGNNLEGGVGGLT
jgi:hypothetical protein